MRHKGLEMTISIIMAILISVAVVLILSFILTSRTDALTALGIQNTQVNLTGFIGG
ncbi:MAG: hypothetical protein ABEJ72_06835 [Candidatus Aenigmatarchaeota archaeon]